MMRRILITGASGFLGRHVVKEFLKNDYHLEQEGDDIGKGTILVPGRDSLDIHNRPALLLYCVTHGVTDIIHLAALCGGIGMNQERPADLISQNMRMGMNIVDVATGLGVHKLVLLGTVCMYPKHTPVPFKEDALWDGYPEETNAPYGIAKKATMVMANANRDQYGLNAITLIPVNLAGEDDHFEDEKSHVIPALIKKFIEARDSHADYVTLWGDGSASREFLYAGDCARAIRMAFEDYDAAAPVNLGTGREITIRDLAEKIRDLTGFEGEIRWDTSKPNGQPRRCLDVSRAKEAFGFEAGTSIDDTLARTIVWYENRNNTGSVS